MSVPSRRTDTSVTPEALFEEIYRSTYRKTLAYALRRTRNRADAHDVVADTYLVAWRRLDELLGVGKPQAWLYGVARRTLTNQRRGMRRHEDLTIRSIRQGGIEGWVPDPAWSTEQRNEFERVEKAMEGLSARDQEILRLVAYEELDHAEVAVVLGIRPGAVRSMLYRARRRLNKVLDEPLTRPIDESGHNTNLSGSPSETPPGDIND